MADSTNPVQQVIAGSGAATQVNDNFASASPALLYARNPVTTTGLTWGYIGGRLGGTLIASGVITLAASTTNYIVALLSSGAVSSATNTTNWNDALYLRLYSVVTGASAVTSYADYRQAYGNAGGGGGSSVQCIPIACSDETTPLTTGSAKVTFRMPYAFTLFEVRSSVTDAPTGSMLTVDINEGGTTILSTKLTIDATEKTSTTAAAAAVISDVNLADDAEITIDIDTVGSTVAGAGLKVYLIGERA